MTCDHCEGTGVIWEPCHVGSAHEYACDCNHEIECANCEGAGTIKRCVCMGGLLDCLPPFGESGGCSLSNDTPALTGERS